MCACRTKVETTENVFLRYHFCSTQKLKPLKNLEKIDPHLLSLSIKNQVFILLYGSQASNSKSLYQEILKIVIPYLKAITRFDRPVINF